MAGNSYKLKFNLSDGTTKEVTFTAPQGPQGEQGVQGIQGEKGEKGDTGVQGEKGDTGVQGIQGEKGEKGDKGDTGAQGATGAKGADGYTPVKGTDYWTEADKEEINAESQSYIAKEIAKKTQLKPEFANSVAECTDTSKLYVLPDGYIYAYMEEAQPSGYTNLFDVSGSGFTQESDTKFYTNWMPYNYEGNDGNGTIYHIKGATPYKMHFATDAAGTGASPLMYCTNANITPITTSDYDDSVKIIQHSTGIAAYKYVQFEVREALPESFIITANEKIVGDEGGTTLSGAWASTGHAFVPADYEDRIVDLEADSANQAKRIAALEAGQSSGGGTSSGGTSSGGTSSGGTSGDVQPPDYWITAIDKLSDTIKENQASGVDAFQFVWFSDMHGVSGYVNTNGAGTSSQENIGKVAQYLCDTFDIPLVATSGDILSQNSYSAVSSVYAEYEKCREILKYIDTEKFLAVIGNHDGAWGAAQNGVYYLKDIGDRALYNEIYRKQATDFKRVFGTGGSYFYVDSYPQKVRIFMLNSNTDGDGSNDSDGNAVYNSQMYSVYGTEQLEWLANSLNSTPEGFTVIAMAHQPLNTSKDGSLVAGMLTAYNKRKTYSGTASLADTYWGNGLSSEYNTSSISCDFASAKGEFAAFFCGHIHQDATYTDYYDFPMISITTAGGDVRGNNPVKRVVGTATETALDVVTIDKLNRKIYTTRVGAGSDREVSY